MPEEEDKKRECQLIIMGKRIMSARKGIAGLA